MTEVSRRTRIRETIIRGIEQDDYSACGGDFCARGHIRAIARAVAADPGPLIGDYDAAHGEPPAANRHPHQVVIRLRGRRGLLGGVHHPGGRYLAQSIVAGGTSQRWVFGHAVDMRLGNPGGITLRVDGANPLPPGTAGPITLRLHRHRENPR